MIVHFKVEEPGEGFKVSWKDVEAAVRAKYPMLKLVYSRADPTEGDLAFSTLRLKKDMIEELCKEPMTINEKPHIFSVTEGETLKEFWSAQGGHYQFCIQTRLRAAKKASKARKMAEKPEAVKRAKTSYEIAGVYYLDINKVKSKSRAILNLKKDGDRLDGNDEAFMKEIISFHDKKDQKMKDFEAFEVN